MKRHVLWRLEYRSRRDLDHLDADEMSERLHDCINNIRTRTEQNQLGLLLPNEGESEKWMIRATEVFEECVVRGYPYPGPVNISGFRDAFEHAFDPIPDVKPVFESLKLSSQPYLLKFGDAYWLQQFLEYGRFRIAPASFYESDELNHARRDTELRRSVNLNPQDRNRGTLPNRRCIEAESDYYLFSLTSKYSARLFGDFASRSCLVIHEPRRFLHRLKTELSKCLKGWRIKDTEVRYYDPVRVNPEHIVVPIFKPFRHAYQDEVRVVALPTKPQVALQPIFVELGSLTEYAAMVTCSQ